MRSHSWPILYMDRVKTPTEALESNTREKLAAHVTS